MNFLQLKKTILLTLLIANTLAALAQTKVDSIYVLELKNKTNYTERNHFWVDSTITLQQEVFYDDPKIIDEESTQIFTIHYPHKSEVVNKAIFDIPNDSSLIKCSYQRLSPWNWFKKELPIKGQIRIINSTKKEIKIEFNLTVVEHKKLICIYRGIRVFKLSKSATGRIAR